jgi:hypothetical protein
MDTSVKLWQNLSTDPMAPANPCNLMDQGDVTIPPSTGFLWKLGGNQSYGLYFPNGTTIAKDGGLVVGTATQPIEVWDNTRGRGNSSLSQEIMAVLMCDNAASGLTFVGHGGVTGAASIPGVDVSQYLTAGSKTAALPQQQGTTAKPAKTMPKPGRNTKAGKIIGIGNWDFIPDLLTT